MLLPESSAATDATVGRSLGVRAALLVLWLVFALAAAACSSASEDAAAAPDADGAASTTAVAVADDSLAEPAAASTGAEPLEDVLPPEALLSTEAEVDALDDAMVEAGLALVGPDCAEGEDRTVTHEPDVVFAPVLAEEESFEAQTVGAETVPAITIPAVFIPGHIIDGGCIIQHAAPAGCLGAIDITEIVLPAISIPSAEFPEVVIDGEVALSAIVADEVVAEAVVVEAVHQDQVCDIEDDGGDSPRIRRPGIRRDGGRREGIRREPLRQPDASVDGVSVGGHSVSPVSAPPISLQPASVPAVTLVRQDTDQDSSSVFENEGETVYFASADVLFAFASSELQPEADEFLAEVAASLQENHPEGSILVGGHTDSVGDDATNQTLSEQRAQTVADWLIEQGGIERDRLVVEGYGATVPVAPNETESGEDDPEGRSLNRRVVIQAAKG